MSDWADEKAREIGNAFYYGMSERGEAAIAAALRQARADALEEAAKVLDANDEGMANNGRDFAQPFANGYRTACYSLAAAIRSLKDKQP